MDKQVDRFNKEYITGKRSGILVTNNKIEVIKYLENTGIY